MWLTLLSSLLRPVPPQERQPGEQPAVSGADQRSVSVTGTGPLGRGHGTPTGCSPLRRGAGKRCCRLPRDAAPLSPCSLRQEQWMNVRVGDIIKLENNQFVAVSLAPK